MIGGESSDIDFSCREYKKDNGILLQVSMDSRIAELSRIEPSLVRKILRSPVRLDLLAFSNIAQVFGRYFQFVCFYVWIYY